MRRQNLCRRNPALDVQLDRIDREGRTHFVDLESAERLIENAPTDDLRFVILRLLHRDVKAGNCRSRARMVRSSSEESRDPATKDFAEDACGRVDDPAGADSDHYYLDGKELVVIKGSYGQDLAADDGERLSQRWAGPTPADGRTWFETRRVDEQGWKSADGLLMRRLPVASPRACGS